MASRALIRGQRTTLLTLFTGYAGYYVCRSSLSIAAPLLVHESGTLSNETIGAIASFGLLVYALGKISNGILTDFFGGRGIFLLGMAGSVVCSAAFGLSAGVAVLASAWALNRYFQSMGWGALLKIAGRWFDPARHASIMGILCGSYLLGDAVARGYLGLFIAAGVGWRGVFWVSAGTLAGVALISRVKLRASPTDIGEPEPAASPGNLYAADSEGESARGLAALLGPLLHSPAFWLICGMNFGLTLIREALTFWSPQFLYEVGGLDAGGAALGSTLFPLVGGVSALLAGWLSDRVGGARGRIIVPAVAGAAFFLWYLSVAPVAGRPGLALALIAAVAFFLIGPYSFLSGVVALDLGGKHGNATVAGLADSAGYLGAIASGWGVGHVAQVYGWSRAFALLAAAAAATVALGAIHWFLQARAAEPAARNPAA